MINILLSLNLTMGTNKVFPLINVRIFPGVNVNIRNSFKNRIIHARGFISGEQKKI